MGKAFIQESTLTDIADAIRSKNGSSDTYLPSEMAQAIQNIPTGGDNTNYFYVEDASGAANTLTIKKSNNALPDKVFEWSLDKQNWTEITVTDTTGVSLAVPANGRVYLRGDNIVLADSTFQTLITCSAIFKVGGDLTTLLAKSGNQASVAKYAVRGLFMSSKVQDASALILPAISVASNSYSYMFHSCTQLIAAPALPATIIDANCYNSMFYGCSALQVAPPLPATTIQNQCYSYMFVNCTNLVRVEVYATSWNTSYANGWLQGVAATGDFYNLGGATIPTGTNGIPSGWTEHTSL